MILFLVVILVLVLSIKWRITTKNKYFQFPPGPPRLPLVGSLPFIPNEKFTSVAFQKLSEKYGDVIHVKIGFRDAITFNSFETVKEILVHEKVAARKHDVMEIFVARAFYRNLGIIWSNNKTWNTIRGFSLRALRTFGFGKDSSMDVVINQELDKLINQIKSQLVSNSKVGIPGDNLFSETTMHVLWRLITGVELELGNPKMQRLLDISEDFSKSISLAFDPSFAFPFTWNMFPKWSGKETQMRCVEELNKFGREIIKEHRDSGIYQVDPQCYMDAFLAKIHDTKNDPTSEFNDDQLLICFLDLFQAGAETSSKTLSFSLLYLLLNPTIQEKVWKEINLKVGMDEMITADMKTRLPYTHATLLECYRISIVVPFTPPRMATEDFYFKGYLIKKGITIMPNLQAANHSKSQWGDPHNFRPERFLSEDGTVDTKIASWLVNFGDGKRVCLGKTLAESSTFICFASIVRTFKLEKVPGQLDPLMEPIPGGSYSPQPFQIQFNPRQ